MSFKMPLKVAKLADLKAKAYIKLAAMLLRNKLKDGDTVQYMLVLNHKYADLDEAKSQKIPLFLVGNFDSTWKDFHKQKLDNGKAQKAFTVQGTCTKNDKSLNLTIDSSKGLNKVPAKPKQYLLALLKKIDKNIELVIGEAQGNASAEEDTTSTVEAPVSKAAPKVKPAAMAAYKAARKEEYLAINETIKALTASLRTVKTKVGKHIKKGTVSSKDLKTIKGAINNFEALDTTFNKSHKTVKVKFAPAFNKLKKRKKELAKLALIAKKRKVSIAQRMANNYFQQTAQRDASEEEIKEIQGLLKATIKHNKQSNFKTSGKQLIKVATFVLGKVGPKRFAPKMTDKVLKKLAA